MALNPAPSVSKLIFAPANEKTNAQADQYTKDSLSRSQLAHDPVTQFHRWFTHAQSHGVHQPETVCLSTAALPSGRVSARFVYLKELDARGGFVVYSNFGTSRKARDLAGNAWASLTFWWREVERQVRVEGVTERLAPAESQVYFDTRIRGSRIGAWASRQSQVLEGGERAELEGWVREAEERFDGVESIPVPEFWGGLRLKPVLVEFWQGRESRLHDRFVYRKKEGGEAEGEGEGEGEWIIERLSP